jgi:hypothetical protein
MQRKANDPTSTAEAYYAFTKCAEDPKLCRRLAEAGLQSHPDRFQTNPASQRGQNSQLLKFPIQRR